MKEKEDENFNPDQHFYSRNFFYFCRGDMCLFYLCCCYVKFGLVASKIITVPENACQNGNSNTFRSVIKRSRKERFVDLIGMDLSQLLKL